MKKRKFLSLFAILFVVIFALSVCFFAACKGGDDDEDNSGDIGTQQDGGDEGLGESGDGEGEGGESSSGSENEEQTRTGDPLDANDKIIGTWTGDVEIRAELMGYGGTIESEMTVVITTEGFTLSFAPSSITYDSIVGLLGLEDYVNGLLEDAGIVVGGEFEMFSNMPVYVDEAGYFVDIDGDYTTCQVSLEVVDGLLCIEFDETMTFGSFPIEIIFDAKLYSEAELAIEKIIDLAGAEDTLTYTTTVGDAVFANDEDLSIRTTDGINYAVSGPASKMGEAEAVYYDDASIEEGTLYVVLKIAVAEGESITFVYSNKTYVNSEGEDAGEFEDGYIYVIQALHEDESGEGYAAMEFVITTEGGVTSTTYTVTFDEVTEPAEPITRIVTIQTRYGGDTVDTITLEVGGDSIDLEGVITMSDGSTPPTLSGCTWVPDDTDVVTVEQNRIFPRYATLTAVSAGETTVTLTLTTGETATITVVVEAPLVKVYDDTVVGFGSGDNTADFKNAHDLEIVTTTDESGTVCSIEGMATLFTEEQAVAFGGGATTSDAYVVIKIPASVGCTVTFNGVEEVITEDSTSGVYILGVRTGTTSDPMKVEITDGSGNTVSEFKISVANLVIPDDVIEGVWTGNVSATAVYSGDTYNATADVALSINVDGTLSITITNISTGDSTVDGALSLFASSITLSGTWSVTDGTYTFALTAGSNVTVNENGDLALEFTTDATTGEMQATMSFDIEYTITIIILGSYSVQISVSDGVLVMG